MANISRDEAFEIYKTVIEKYESGTKRQKDLAEELEISKDAVSWCTQYHGYHHTKALNGKKFMICDDKLDELIELL